MMPGQGSDGKNLSRTRESCGGSAGGGVVVGARGFERPLMYSSNYPGTSSTPAMHCWACMECVKVPKTCDLQFDFALHKRPSHEAAHVLLQQGGSWPNPGYFAEIS